MVVSDPQISSLLSGQIIRSGQHGQYLITRETVEDMHRQLQERPVPVNIEHDPTVPPVGRITDSRLVELEDGELALETDTEIFDGTVPAALYAHSDLASAVQALEHLPAEAGPVDVIVDDRLYSKEDLEALRVIIAEVGGANARDGALRFSQLPDALLVFSLGSTGTAMFWFSKGFFTKLGERTAEELGEEVGKDLAGAYRALKTRSAKLLRVETRLPSHRSRCLRSRLAVQMGVQWKLKEARVQATLALMISLMQARSCWRSLACSWTERVSRLRSPRCISRAKTELGTFATGSTIRLGLS
jgi:hypothetical protein